MERTCILHCYSYRFQCLVYSRCLHFGGVHCPLRDMHMHWFQTSTPSLDRILSQTTLMYTEHPAVIKFKWTQVQTILIGICTFVAFTVNVLHPCICTHISPRPPALKRKQWLVFKRPYLCNHEHFCVSGTILFPEMLNQFIGDIHCYRDMHI